MSVDLPAARDAVLARLGPRQPELAIVLGSGLGGLAERVMDAVRIPYSTIPGFQMPRVEGHQGELVAGTLAGKPVLAQSGRFHMYEGWSAEAAALPVRVFGALGIRTLIVTNAAGGVRRSFAAGTIMLIADHLNLTGRNPLLGHTRHGEERFPDMSAAYDPALRTVARETAHALGIPLEEGVYAGLLGPNYETPAEVRVYASMHAHAVGMSTVMECIAARWAGLEVCGVSLVTNAGAGYTGEPLTHEEVLAAGAEAGPRLARVIRRFVADLDG